MNKLLLLLLLFHILACHSENGRDKPFTQELDLPEKGDSTETVDRSVPDLLMNRIEASGILEKYRTQVYSQEGWTLNLWRPPGTEDYYGDSVVHVQIIASGSERYENLKDIFFAVDSDKVYYRDLLEDTLYLAEEF